MVSDWPPVGLRKLVVTARGVDVRFPVQTWGFGASSGAPLPRPQRGETPAALR